MIVAVVADEVAVRGDPPGELGLGLGPAALEEERRGDLARGEDVEEPLGDAGPVRPVGMLGVERQGDPERRRVIGPLTLLLDPGDHDPAGEDPLEHEEDQDHRDHQRHHGPGLDERRVQAM